MNISYVRRRLAQSRVMFAAARSNTARISHSGLVDRYEMLLAQRVAENETLNDDEAQRSRADGDKVFNFTCSD